MAYKSLMVAGSDWGKPESFEIESTFPCMDTEYRNLRLVIKLVKVFDTVDLLLTFENTTIATYFQNREKAITYGTFSETLILQEFKRAEKLNPTTALYEIVFTGEGV